MPPARSTALVVQPPPRAARQRQPFRLGQAGLMRAALVLLMAVTAVLGHFGLGSTRELFIAGSVMVGWWAWRQGPSRHVEVAIALFAVAPLLRRIVDYSAGYDPQGLMLMAPLLVITLPAVDGLGFLDRQRGTGELSPFVLFGVCVIYGTLVSYLEGDVNGALTNGLKWLAPLIYGVCVLDYARRDRALLDSATRTFEVVLPLIALYGIMQWFDPPGWDRYWMSNSQMWSIGLPEPFKIRVFGTMNSPASFGTFIATGLLLFSFAPRRRAVMLLALPVAVALLLSQYRTAWISLAAGMAFCCLFRRTRGRAGLIALGLLIAVGAAATTGPFEKVVTHRLGTLTGGVSHDVSAVERVQELQMLYDRSDHLAVGDGLGVLSAVTPTTMQIDGMIVSCVLGMGLIGGSLCLVALVWCVGRALARVSRVRNGPAIVLGAQVIGFVVQIPLASITSGELGFLFWLVTGLALAQSIPAAGRSMHFAGIPLSRLPG